MTLHDNIKTRRSVMPSQFSKKEVENEVIKQLLEAANWAPNHRLTEPWRFKVVQGESKTKLGQFLAKKYKDTSKKFSEFKYKKIQNKVNQSSAVIIICMQIDENQSVPEWEEIAATAMAVQNLWLTVTNLGLGGYWSSPSLINYMDEFFNLNKGERCLGLFYLGYVETPSPQRTPNPIEDKVEWLK